MSLPDGSSVNIVEFFVLPQTAQPTGGSTVRMSFDVLVPKVCSNADGSGETFSKRFQTDVVRADLDQPVSETQRNEVLAAGWDQVESEVLQWASTNAVCPVGKTFDPVTKSVTP